MWAGKIVVVEDAAALLCFALPSTGEAKNRWGKTKDDARYRRLVYVTNYHRLFEQNENQSLAEDD